MLIGQQVTHLFVLAIPIACISWTFTHEKLFGELHDYCVQKSEHGRSLFTRKFFYLLTCEYCFSHYITIGALIVTGYRLLYNDWRGYLVGGFSLVWIANVYMSLYARIRMDIKKDRIEIEEKEANK